MQGLHEVAAVFAYIQSVSGFAGDDTSALSCFISFVRIFMPCFYDGESFVILHITLLFFRQLLLYHLPHLHNQLEEAGVAPVVYATPWFITLFAYKNPLHVTMRLWHEYIRRGDPTFVPFLAVALMDLEKQAFLDAQEDDFNSAVDRTRITSLEKLKDVWKAAENLHARTPKSFTFRMSKVLTQVRQQLRKTGTGAEWTGSVLARAEQERRLALLAREAVAHLVRDGDVTAVAAEGVMLLDVRPKAAFDTEHLSCAVHFYPSCLQRFALLSAGLSQPKTERLAAALKQAVLDVGDLVLRKDSTPSAAGGATPVDATALGSEVFQALQVTASEAWGEGWLSDSKRAHLAILGGDDDWDSAQLCKSDAGGALASLFELLTEQLSMPRVSVVLGGAAGPDSEITPVRWVLRQLRPVSYRFVRGDFWGVDAKHIRFGFIADEIQQVLPEVVREVNVAEGPRKSIVYTDLIAILTAAVRDFGSEVEAVKKRVALAEAALNDLDEKEPMT
eukprot:symbB.v1.2.030850.t4/scaffold3518.1/size54960/1